MGRVILITGSSSGIGASLARAVAKPGVKLVLHARQSRAQLEVVAEEVRSQGAEAVTCLGDLAEKGMASHLIHVAEKEFGGLDALVANAGFAIHKPSLEDGEERDLEFALRANLLSLFAMIRSSLSMLKQSPAPRIVAVGSYTAHAFQGWSIRYPYSAASKGAIEAAVRSLTPELADSNILINCVVPGEINSSHQLVLNENLRRVESMVPLRRLGRPEEVAAVIEFLISERSSYVTGQVIHVNGGLV